MKAVQLLSQDQISISEIDLPTLKSEEVLIKVAGVGVNPVDWKIASGQLAQLIDQPLPLTLGSDVAGEVVESAHGFKAGDKVYAMKTIGQTGSLSEYCSVKRSHLARAPKNLSLAQAASLPMAALTSWQALFVAGKLSREQRVLIQAGAGGVGSIAIQLAKIMGAYVITTASEKNRDYLLALGADEVIDYESQSVIDELAEQPVDLVIESMWGQFQLDAVAVLKPQGRLVSLSGLMPETVAAAKEANVRAEFVFVQPNAEQLNHITELVESKQLLAHANKLFQVDDIELAYQESQQGHVRGKLVAVF
ncbi:NADP-dependent oxidoreductase [Motilimonas pumila]|uniref:NADP-dependent oxidoreductase n=1 Tax=Motilimonas pumila TaxID=2303987 RepID=A0A418YEL6_9GAMM|nr:NADP-dependent oxidoreductase [Motilimonas pumila]RJG47558.1 NADP-dependent oxidoreductase [Motilimonas pumila]